MSFPGSDASRYLMSPVDALRVLDSLEYDEQVDIVMFIKSASNPVIGEESRTFDGAAGLFITSYFFQSYALEAAGLVSPQPLVVIRQSDAATATLASLHYKQSQDLVVSIEVYRAGGLDVIADPFFKISFEGGRISSHQLFMGGRPIRRPHEILTIDFVTGRVETAPQLVSGLRGALRTAAFSRAPGQRGA